MKKTGLLIKKFSGLQIKNGTFFYFFFIVNSNKLCKPFTYLKVINCDGHSVLAATLCDLEKKVSTKPGLSLLERDQWEWLKLKLVQICDINSSLGFFLLKGPQ